MTDITIPYDEDTISGSFDYDITNSGNEITIFTQGFSAGTITFNFLDGTNKRVYKTYTTDIGDVITIKGRQCNVTGTGVTCTYLSIA